MTTEAAASPGLRTRQALPMGFVQPFMAMMERDFRVLLRDIVPFGVRTAMQPFLFVFVFTYVQPKIGAGAPGFQDVLVPGLIASSVIFQGIQAVAIPLVMEFSQTREIEDRVMAPLPVWGVALQKMTFAFLQSLLVVAVVFPLVYIVPVNTPKLHISILALITVVPLGAFLSASMGLLIGTAVNPRQITLVFALIVMPLTFLGAVYYPWSQLEAIRWLQVLTLLNPLVYMSEGLRGALTPEYGHMSYWAVYGGLIFCCAACTWGGIRMFSKRVLS